MLLSLPLGGAGNASGQRFVQETALMRREGAKATFWGMRVGEQPAPRSKTAPQPSVGAVGGETFPPEAQHPRTQEPEQPSSGRVGDLA